jgi:hypothetical protein
MQDRISSSHLVWILVAGLPFACGKSQDTAGTDTNDPTSTPTGTTNTAAGRLAAVSDIGSFKLKNALKLKVPKALQKNKGSALNLMAAARSEEACVLGENLKEVVSNVSGMGSFFCHLEVEKDKIKFGKKYKVVDKDGVDAGKIFVDNSAAGTGKVAVNLCFSDPTMFSGQTITVTDVNENGAQGNVALTYSMPASAEQSASTGGQSVTFDSLTAKKNLIIAKDLFNAGTTSYRRLAVLDLREGDVSTLGLSSVIRTDSVEIAKRGVSALDDTHGSALLKDKGSYENLPFDYTRRAFFNAAGEVVAVGDSPKFAEGGSLFLKADKVPAALDGAFKPDAPSTWIASQCDGVDEELKIDFESEAHKACNEPEENFDSKSCYDNTVYTDGTDATDVTL